MLSLYSNSVNAQDSVKSNNRPESAEKMQQQDRRDDEDPTVHKDPISEQPANPQSLSLFPPINQARQESEEDVMKYQQ